MRLLLDLVGWVAVGLKLQWSISCHTPIPPLRFVSLLRMASQRGRSPRVGSQPSVAPRVEGGKAGCWRAVVQYGGRRHLGATRSTRGLAEADRDAARCLPTLEAQISYLQGLVRPRGRPRGSAAVPAAAGSEVPPSAVVPAAAGSEVPPSTPRRELPGVSGGAGAFSTPLGALASPAVAVSCAAASTPDVAEALARAWPRCEPRSRCAPPGTQSATVRYDLAPPLTLSAEASLLEGRFVHPLVKALYTELVKLRGTGLRVVWPARHGSNALYRRLQKVRERYRQDLARCRCAPDAVC